MHTQSIVYSPSDFAGADVGPDTLAVCATLSHPVVVVLADGNWAGVLG